MGARTRAFALETMNAIELHDVPQADADDQVLDHLDPEVRVGEIFALLGPNGAGRTTAGEIVEGYRRVDGGRMDVTLSYLDDAVPCTSPTTGPDSRRESCRIVVHSRADRGSTRPFGGSSRSPAGSRSSPATSRARCRR